MVGNTCTGMVFPWHRPEIEKTGHFTPCYTTPTVDTGIPDGQGQVRAVFDGGGLGAGPGG